MVDRQAWAQSIFDEAPNLPIDQLLFHYTSVERAAAIALTGRLVLSPLSVLNDPRESQIRGTVRVTYGLPALDVGAEADEERLVDEHESTLRELRARIRVACFTHDERDNEVVSRDNDVRGFARQRMWAQYADANRGCCLVLDRQSLTRTQALLGRSGRKSTTSLVLTSRCTKRSRPSSTIRSPDATAPTQPPNTSGL